MFFLISLLKKSSIINNIKYLNINTFYYLSMFINYDIINMNEHPTIKKNDLFSFLYVCSDIMNGKEEFLINNNNNNKDIMQSLIVDIAKHNISKIWNEQPSEKHFISFWMKHRNNCCNGQ